MIKDYRFKSSLLGKQILQVSKGEQECVHEGETIRYTVWHDADRWEAEELLKSGGGHMIWHVIQ